MDRKTNSICPVCFRRIPAEYIEENGNVYLEKNCPIHGFFRTVVWRGKPSVSEWLRKETLTAPRVTDHEVRLGCPYDCGICSRHLQEACCVMIEITSRCSFGCPICFAGSGLSGSDLSLIRYTALLDDLIKRSPENRFNIQLSGGEPAEHPDLAEFIRLAKEKGFPYVQINSNGARLSEDLSFCEELKTAGLNSVFLQFDGTDDSIYRKMRGKDLLDQKQKAIVNCRSAGLSIVLSVALVPGINTQDIGNTIRFGMQNMPAVRGIHFLPVSYMGRLFLDPKDDDRFTLPELIRSISIQTGFQISPSDLLPITSGSCFCGLYGNFLVDPVAGTVTSISEAGGGCCSCKKDAIASAREYLARRWGKTVEEAGDEWDLFTKQAEDQGFSITSMPFMDAWNFDENRLRRCRLQVPTADGRMIPFCAFHVTNTRGERLYHG